MVPDSITLTREELYERVWTEPMAILAPKLGLSDVGLKKTCARLRIPSPPRGYWARVAAGQKVRKTPLPKFPTTAGAGLRDATFYPTARESTASEPLTGPVADQARFEALPGNRMLVPEILTTPHPLVAKTVLALRKSKPDEAGRLRARTQQLLDVDVTMGSVDRAMCVLDTLIKGLEARGYPVSLATPTLDRSSYGQPTPQPIRTVVRIGEDEIAFALSETVTRTLRAPTRSDGGWEPKTYDYAPTGRLVFEIRESMLGTRGKWSDGARQRVDTILGDIIVGLVETAEALRARRERWAEEARQREIEEAKKREEQKLAHLEDERVRALDRFMRRWRKARAVREYAVAAWEAAERYGHADHAGLNAWLRWVEAYAERLDPFGEGSIEYHDDSHSAPEYHSWNRPADDNRPIW